MSETRTYLERVLAWAPVGDPNAYMNIHFPLTMLNQQGKPAWAGRACTSLKEMVDEVRNAERWMKSKGDMYACLSSQRMSQPVQVAGGRTINKAVRGQRSAVHLRSLFLDIDVKVGAYDTQKDALKALAQFVIDAQLPRPTMVVSSGTGGLHVYWCLDVALTVAEWQPLANALAEATQRHDLKTDTQCTTDAARILRIPGTFNYKTNPPSPVSIVGRVVPTDYDVGVLRAALAPYATATNHLRPKAGTPVQAPQNDEWSGGLSREARPVVLTSVAEQCPFIHEAIETGGEHFANPLWNMTTLIAVFSEDGRAMAHKMALGHPSYNPDETEALFERKVQEKEAKDLGWPSCQSIANAGCLSCKACPHFKHGKSPLHLGKTSVQINGNEDDDLPAGYIREANSGKIFRLVSDGKGGVEPKPLIDIPMTKPWVQDNPWALNFITRVGRGKEMTITVPQELFSAFDALGKYLNSVGVPITRDQASKLGDFFVSWVMQIRNIRKDVATLPPYGWIVQGGKIAGFAFAGTAYTEAGPVPASRASGQVGMSYTAVGDLEPWLKAARFITDQKRPGLDVLLASAFAAPLVRFTGEKGVFISANSESGVGKTTTLHTAVAVWGAPTASKMILSDTINGAAGKLGTLKNLPAFWDEIKSEDEFTAFTSFLFQLSSGRDKLRMDHTAKLRPTYSWETMLVCCANDSVLDFVTQRTKGNDAGFYRVFEYKIAKAPKTAPPGDVARMVAELEYNHGRAGELYAKFLGENVEYVQKLVRDTHNKLHDRLGGGTNERYWQAALATLISGAQISNQIGLTEIDMREMVKFLLKVFDDMRGERKNMNDVVDVVLSREATLSKFFSEKSQRHTLFTDHIMSHKGRLGEHQIRVFNDPTRLDGVQIQIALHQKIILVSISALRDWCILRGVSYRQIKLALDENYGVRTGRYTLGRGTGIVRQMRENCLVIDASTGLFSTLCEMSGKP